MITKSAKDAAGDKVTLCGVFKNSKGPTRRATDLQFEPTSTVGPILKACLVWTC